MNGLPIKQGAIFGAIAYVGGYILTYILATIDSEFEVNQTIEELGGGMMEAVGWVFYGAHRIEIEVTAEGGGESQTETLRIFEEASPDLPEILYYLVPVVMLIVAGYLVVGQIRAYGGSEAIKAGATVAVGYLPLTVLGVFLFRLSEEQSGFGQTISVSISPELVPAALIMGLIFPLVFGAIGGYLNVVSR